MAARGIAVTDLAKRTSNRFEGTAAVVIEPAGRFLRWWWRELVAMLPHSLQRLIGAETNLLVIDITAPHLEVHLWQGKHCRPLGQMRIVKAANQSSSNDSIAKWGIHADEVILRLPADQVLQRDVVLPLAAEDNLREVLGFEMDRLTPFARDQVAYDFVKTRRNEEEGTLRVRLYVIPKSKLELLKSRLANLGIHATAATLRNSTILKSLPDFPVKPNLMEEVSVAQGRSPLRHVVRVSAWAVAALLALVVLLPLWNQARYIDTLELAIGSLQSTAQKSREFETRLGGVAEDIDYLVNARNNTPPVLEYLNELTRILPDDTWLHRFELRGKQMSLQGESVNASSMISRMENSKNFTETQFVAPVVRSASTATERFNMRTTLVGRDAP